MPAGVAGSVGLAEKALDPRCQSPGLVPSCYSDVLVTAPTISNGYNTIVIRVNGTTPPPTPVFDDDLVAGPTQMLPCKGSTATPPCVVGIKGYNQSATDPNNPPYFLVTIHDSSGTHIWS